jgi:glycosyltransferase involved in cell wall biosynthesis
MKKFADGIIGISEGTAVRFSEEAKINGKFRVIFNGVDCSLFQPVSIM